MDPKGFLGADGPPAVGRSHRQAGERRKRLYALLGELPDRARPISARALAREERPGYVLEKLQLDLNGIEPVPAYFVRPRKLRGRAPAVLYNHAHGGDYQLGKDEFIKGRKGSRPRLTPRSSPGSAGRACASTPGCSASAPIPRNWTCSKRCSGRAASSGA